MNIKRQQGRIVDYTAKPGSLYYDKVITPSFKLYQMSGAEYDHWRAVHSATIIPGIEAYADRVLDEAKKREDRRVRLSQEEWVKKRLQEHPPKPRIEWRVPGCFDDDKIKTTIKLIE